MASVNKVILIGNLGNDPEVKYSNSGMAIANFSIATTDRYQDKKTNEWQEKTEWHRIVFFDKKAEVAAKYLHKGSQVFIEGKLETNKWTDKNGIERYTTKIIGTDLKMLGNKDNNGSTSTSNNYKPPKTTSAPPLPDKDLDDDVPF